MAKRSDISLEDQYAIDQVAASMAIEDMPLTRECYDRLHAIAAGEKTIEEAFEELDRKWQR